MVPPTKQIKVLHYVWWKNSHVSQIVQLMQEFGVDAQQSKALFPTSILRIMLAPLAMIGYRILGYDIIHLHWVAGHFRPATSKSTWARNFYYVWFKLFLWIGHLVGLKLVWTAHNILPHDRIFPDDVKARKYLVSHVDQVFALNATSAKVIQDEFQAHNVIEIPVAEVIPEPSESRERTREQLGLVETDVLFSHFGHIRPYKGTDKFISAMSGFESHVKFLIAGTPGPADYMQRIHELKQEVILEGTPLTYREGFLLDAELANLIQASDFVVCPFETINNSGFVNIAFKMEKPVILSDIPGLAWVPRDAAVWIEPINDAECLAKTLTSAMRLTDDQRVSITKNARTYIEHHSWDSYVSAQVDVYRALVQ